MVPLASDGVALLRVDLLFLIIINCDNSSAMSCSLELARQVGIRRSYSSCQNVLLIKRRNASFGIMRICTGVFFTCIAILVTKLSVYHHQVYEDFRSSTLSSRLRWCAWRSSLRISSECVRPSLHQNIKWRCVAFVSISDHPSSRRAPTLPAEGAIL